MSGPAARAIEVAKTGRPRLALRLPSMGSTTTQGPPVAGLALADLLADQPEGAAGGLEHRDDGVLGGPVDDHRRVPAGPRADRPAPLARGHVADGRAGGVAGAPHHGEPAVRVGQSVSGWKATPVRSFGKK